MLNGLYLYSNNFIFYQLGRINSIGYFLSDSNYILNKPHFVLLDFFYLYHHLASIYLFNTSIPPVLLSKIVTLAEISNLPSYLVYHYMTQNRLILENYILEKYPKVYLFFYSYSYFNKFNVRNFNLLSDQTKLEIIPTIPVYLMGIIWTYKLWTNK